MDYDVIVIGAGLSGLTAASLLSYRGLKVCVVENASTPGGSCGIFRRGTTTFDQGAAMLYGFGEKGFNSHKFVFDSLHEPIQMIKHDCLYCVVFNGKRIHFWPDIDRFILELCELFPDQKDNLERFYKDMIKLYNDVIVNNPAYTTADETDFKIASKSIKKHPVSYIRFLGMLNRSAKWLLKKYFTNEKIFDFFDKLTSTYCYTTLEQSPAVLSAVMFVDNHVGGSYYPAGSTLFLPGKLEKVIEENDGDMIYNSKVKSILFIKDKPSGVILENGTIIKANDIIYSGTVWNLYGKLIDENHVDKEKIAWAKNQEPTYPSVIYYSVVDKSVITPETLPIEMLVGNPKKIDESEITVYILSIDDRTLCNDDEQTVIAIGPTFKKWNKSNQEEYENQKVIEQKRIVDVLSKRFPGFEKAIRYQELASPCTIESYLMKNGGAVAGPKQSLGQHMFKRLHTRTKWDNFFCCGESTVMGTGTPTVTTSGITAANTILKKYNMVPYEYKNGMKSYVQLVDKPFTKKDLFIGFGEHDKGIMNLAFKCQFCENPECCKGYSTDIPGIMRRIVVGNFVGAKKCFLANPAQSELLKQFEGNCINKKENEEAVHIEEIIKKLMD